jgi:hypothetical protein
MRDYIIKGMRVGCFLLAAMLVGFALYRVASEPTGAPDKSVTAAEPPAVPETAPAPATVSGGSRAVPAPPPRTAKGAPKRPKETAVAQTAPIPEPVVVEPAIPMPEVKHEPASVTVVAQDTSVAPVEKPEPAPVVDRSDPMQSRGKRWLKSVGRFLHVGGKKDVPQQAIRTN